MVHPILTPRINNNDDEVRFSRFVAKPGEAVSAGADLLEVETDKANFVVQAERDGYLIAVVPSVGESVRVGSVLGWLGDSPGDAPPAPPREEEKEPAVRPAREATAKARLMMEEAGLDISQIRASGDRITAADVEAFLALRPASAPARVSSSPAPPAEAIPAGPGAFEPLSMEERGMLRSVLWHRDVAAPAYLEISYDHGRWEAYAASYAERNRLLADPLLPLMAYRLVAIARSHPRANCVVAGERRFRYGQVNLGFTIQTESTLYLAVVRNAGEMSAAEFVRALNRLHKKVLAQRLAPDELSGATVGFSSMARWKANRHIPILPSHVSLMVAHTVGQNGEGVLGATYDHRLLSGGDTVAILNALAVPPAGSDESTE